METRNPSKSPGAASPGELSINVRFFALYRERAGGPTHTFRLPPGSTVADLVSAVRRRFPELAPPGVDIVVAVNQEFADKEEVLKQGDEVALIPPVSGGCI
ncbi:MAG: molybdopterin converting factor subunit 1 [SAR202 cluster bacterium]|nr:molybdopterin converting factor subunit 1 [SAR202 cluster bacterium]